ncbi:MAG: hypothetical protein JSW07_13995 [bacterium]|nr:MAG: hypothetical protein JSW07_13995 [bacterium]
MGKRIVKRYFVVFRIFMICCIIIFMLQEGGYSQRGSREWRMAFMPNVRCAFPNAISWLKEFKSNDLKIEVVDVPEGIIRPSDTIKNIHILVALKGECDPEKWEPLFTPSEKIQIHFWPMTRGSITGFEEIKDLSSDRVLILCDESDLLSRTCSIFFDALEGINNLPSPQKMRRKDFENNWPPYNEFQDGDQLNTIILPLVNYKPNGMLLKVIRHAQRKSVVIPKAFCVEFFDMLDSLRSESIEWPRNRISNVFFPGVIAKDYLDLRQRQLFPVQTTTEIVLLIRKQSNGKFLTEHDRRLLLGDLKAIYTTLNQEVDMAMKAATQAWQDLDNLTNSTVDSISNHVWQITEKARWTLVLCLDRRLNDQNRKRLRKFIRDFVNTFSKKAKETFVYRMHVRFHELDFLLDQNDFWAINNLVDIYNKVGNHAGAKILAETIIDEDINLTVDILYDSDDPIKDTEHQHDEKLAKFFENYALALEKLKMDPRFVRKEVRDLRSKWKINP